MRIITQIAIIINILSVILLSIGFFHNFEQPKTKAVYGYSIAGCMLAYIVALSLITIYGIAVSHNLYSAFLFLCVISPFVIGKLVKYETLKKYTFIQIMCFVISLLILLIKF
jgi:hypothetical protein